MKINVGSTKTRRVEGCMPTVHVNEHISHLFLVALLLTLNK